MRQPNPLEQIRAKRLVLEMTLNGPRVPGHAELCLDLQAELEILLHIYHPHVVPPLGDPFIQSDINHPVSLMRAQEVELWDGMTMDPPSSCLRVL